MLRKSHKDAAACQVKILNVKSLGSKKQSVFLMIEVFDEIYAFLRLFFFALSSLCQSPLFFNIGDEQVKCEIVD